MMGVSSFDSTRIGVVYSRRTVGGAPSALEWRRPGTSYMALSQGVVIGWQRMLADDGFMFSWNGDDVLERHGRYGNLIWNLAAV